MPYIRKLPSGRWQATVRLQNGHRRTKTDKLKKVVSDWAKEQETKVSRGEHRDPRDGQIKLGEWRKRVSASRVLDPNTVAKLDSIWRRHCEAQWGEWPMNGVTRAEAQGWIERLRKTPKHGHEGDGPGAPVIGAETIQACVSTMSKLYTIALRETPPLVSINPFSNLELPPIQPRPIEYYEHEEAELLYAAFEELWGVKWRAAVELGMQVGLRPGEIYGLHARRVTWPRRLLEVVDVMTRYGLREHPKSKKSHRSVPVPEAPLEVMASLVKGRQVFAKCTCPKVMPNGSRVAGEGPCPGLIFAADDGAPVDDKTFRDRLWEPAVAKAGIRRFPPKIMRHTAASWLVADGVPLYDVQLLLGHESPVTTQRYAHLAPDAHHSVLASWARRSGQDRLVLTHQ